MDYVLREGTVEWGLPRVTLSVMNRSPPILFKRRT